MSVWGLQNNPKRPLKSTHSSRSIRAQDTSQTVSPFALALVTATREDPGQSQGMARI